MDLRKNWIGWLKELSRFFFGVETFNRCLDFLRRFDVPGFFENLSYWILRATARPVLMFALVRFDDLMSWLTSAD